MSECMNLYVCLGVRVVVCECVSVPACVCLFMCMGGSACGNVCMFVCTSERMQSILKNTRHPFICSVLEKTVCMKNRIREAEFS